MKTIALLFALCAFATSAFSAEYLGLNLGVATKEQVSQILKASNAPFEDDWGYKGYTKDLPSYKVLGYERFSRLGTVQEAWLEFSPKGVLHRIIVKYRDAGETHKILKDALDTKYGRAELAGMGFNTESNYRDGQARIALARNTFGFGDDQSTTLVYAWTPFNGEVNLMKATIEDDIKKKNAKKVGKDL